MQPIVVNLSCDGTSYYNAAWAGNLDRVRELLAQGHDVNERSEDDETALHIAVKGSEIELVRYLVEQGADLEATNRSSGTPLVYSICKAIFAILVSSGADVSVRHIDRNTVLYWIGMYNRGPTWMTCLFDAVDIDPRTLFSVKNIHGDTPLHLLHSLPSTKCLVENRFDSSPTV